MARNGRAGESGRISLAAPLLVARTEGVAALASPRPSRLAMGIATAAASAAAISPALVLGNAQLLIGITSASVIALLLAVLAIRTNPIPIVLSFVPATVFASSGLAPAATYFLPTATLGLSLALVVAAGALATGTIPALPSRPIIASAGLYILAAGVATVFSISRSMSVPYLAGIAVVLASSLWLGPWILAAASRTGSLFAIIGAIGVAVVAISILFSFTGPIEWFGRWLGVYLVNELTIGAHPTNAMLLRTSGPFLAPGGQALVLVPSILALLAIRADVGRRGMVLVIVAIVITVLGLLSTFARAGWLAVIIGSAILAIRDIRVRRIDIAAAAVCLVVAAAFGALLVNWIGADYRPDLTLARTPPALVQSEDPATGDQIVPIPHVPDAGSVGQTPGEEPRFQTRGGSELSGRLEVWTASIRAIEASPWVGYGPGTDALAIDPYLSGDSRRLAGLTSHNTWLRTWVEFGIAGIAAFGLFVVVTIANGFRRGSRPGQGSDWGAIAIFAGLLAAQGFETFLLGGVNMPSFLWSFAAGMMAVGSGTISLRSAAAPQVVSGT